jgi:hypothetical protein
VGDWGSLKIGTRLNGRDDDDYITTSEWEGDDDIITVE